MFCPAWLLGLAFAGLAFAGCTKKGPPDEPEQPPAPLVPAPVAIADAAPSDPVIAAGAAVWGKYCALCHGPTARGYIADNAPSLVTSTFLATASDAFLRAGIGRGRPGTAMAGYATAVGGPLADAQITQLIAFIRNGAPAPAALPATPVSGDAARGATIYTEKCAGCHGTPGIRGEAVYLANPVFLETASDAFLRHAIVNGRPDTKMLAFAGTLPDADIDAVVAHVRSFARPAAAAPDPAAVPAPTTAVINPKGKPPTFTLRDGRFVPAAEVKRALDLKRRIILVDARPPSDWLRGHIPGAVPVPHYDTAAIEALPNDGTWIVAYCACPHHASGEVVDQLQQRGYPHTAVLDEGILVWGGKLGYPVVTGDGKRVPRSELAPRNIKEPAVQ